MIKKKEEHLNFCRQCVENYDENIRDWIKFYTQKKCSRNPQRGRGKVSD